MSISRLQQAREDAGYSREQVAKIMSVGEGYVAWVEEARVELRPEIAERLAALYRCSPEWLMGAPEREAEGPEAGS